MAFTGVNRANVAVTDTFDTWRIRTNEINNTLNLAVSANTADTIMYRDNAGSANLNVLEANSAIVTHTGSTDTAFSVVSAVAAQGDGSYASIKTTGGLYATLSSKFAADLTVGTDLTVSGNTALGSSTADEVTFTSTLAGDILPTVTSGAGTITAGAATGSDLGAAANSFAHIYTVQETISATSGITTNVFSVTSAAGAGNTATFVNDSAALNSVILSVLSASTDTATRNLVQITNDADAAVGTTALSIQSDAGRGIFVDSTLSSGGYSFEVDGGHTTQNTAKIDSAATSGTMLELTASGILTGKGVNLTADSATTGTGIFMTMDGLTSGKMIDLTSTGTLAGAGRIIDITADSATTGTGLQMSMDGLTSGKMVDLSSSGTITGKIIDITADSATSGMGIDISMDALTTGSALRINSISTHSGNLVSFVSDGAATGPTLYVRNDATTSTVKALQIANTTADIFSVTVAGDATVANDLTIAGDFIVTGNLAVSGSTTEINTTTTIARDASIVLGAQSAIVTGATYTAASPAVVTSTAHGLADTNVIFVVASSATSSSDVAVPSERLFKVANKTTNTFELETIDGNCELESATVTGDATGYLILDCTDGGTANAGDNILMSEGVDATGDSSRTFSWVGPQTDAATDDAGIVVPGSTAKHYVKWDDTDNYWKLNDSLMIESSGQFVFPKGTTADRPAAAKSGTLAAAVQGAQRFNTTTSKFEGITSGTTYENISTEGFSISVAIALG